MATIPDDVRRRLEAAGVLVARSVTEHLHQLAVYGASVVWVPDDVSAATQLFLEAQALLPSPAPLASPLSGSGCYGQAIARDIPDTSLDEWTAGVEALLAAHDYWQADAARVLREEA